MKVVISFILKCIVATCSMVGVLICLFGSVNQFMNGGGALLYFTIQSNIWIGVVCMAGIVLMVTKHPVQRWMYIVKLIFTVSITLTGLVFCFVLAPTMSASVWAPVNVITHVVVPVGAIADFFVYDCDRDYKLRHGFLTTIPPLCYLVFATVGYVAGWQFGGGNNYPYFFLNWGSPAGAFGFSDRLPFMGVVYWIVVMVALVAGIGMLYIFIANRIKRSSCMKAHNKV